jgi:S1-C subfamily serine protease/mono/diheme cytochrome c family protein
VSRRLASTLTALLLLARPAVAAKRDEAERLLFLLEYVGADYGTAVENGAIADPYEYEEMSRFARTLVERCGELDSPRVPEGACESLVGLERLIRDLAPWDDVRSLTSELLAKLWSGGDLGSFPLQTPDLLQGARLYADDCAPCHGPVGGGDGFADPGLDPKPSSFREARMNLVSPHQVLGAMRFGVGGTGMPSFDGALTPANLWDIAFHVLTLREDFAPKPVRPRLALTIDDLARHSSEDLIARLAREGKSAVLADIDYFRAHPAEAGSPVASESTPLEAGDDDALRTALRLQDAFAHVADRVLPSVVTVSVFERSKAKTKAPTPSPPTEAWRAAESELALYPGFERARSGSGFFATRAGLILTCYTNVTQANGTIADVLDVELVDGQHVLSRVVGAEPTINLAVVALDVVSEQRPPAITPAELGDADAIRVGHWTIGIGDPWGPDRAYSVGTLAATAQRACYQEQLSATLLQASLAVHREAYGGPLVDIRGRVVGMLVPAPVGDALAPRAVEFALPIGLAMNVGQALAVAESRRSPWLGCSVLELATIHKRFRESGTPSPRLPRTGVYIDDVFEPSPASRAGVRVGDCLVSIDGNRLLSVLDFQKWMYLSGIGRTVRLELFRDGTTVNLDVSIEARPQSATPR